MFRARNWIVIFLSLGFFLRCTGLDLGGEAFMPGIPHYGGEWELIFYDEFDGSSIDRNKWTTGYWWDRDGSNNGSSNEIQWYQADDVLVSNGTLKLRARERSVTAWDGSEYNYTSGIVTTGRETSDKSLPAKFLFQYGYAEIRCKVPKGQGLWPAFWLLPATHESRPEIDVMEILGHDTTELNMNYHYLTTLGLRGDDGYDWFGPDFSEGWHTFAVDWQPHVIIWYVDGVERWRFTDSKHISHEPMYLIANLAVGGDWPGDPDETTPFPSYFEIDYIKVWARGKQIALSPTADVFVHDSEPDVNYGSEPSLHVDGDPVKVSYIKFDASALADKRITSVRLQLNTSSLTHAGSPHGLLVALTGGDAWEEQDLNYHIRPTVLRGALGGLVETHPDTTYEVPLDVSIVQRRMGRTVSLALYTSESDGVYLHARENPAFGPKLLVTSIER
ncbi:MAG: glycoside hydrolase family 16 protein [Spirochaetaceae bacterium]|nr:MAG: glycoside hydrolase family 16 protein [Spirochaetaceae bacterium]